MRGFWKLAAATLIALICVAWHPVVIQKESVFRDVVTDGDGDEVVDSRLIRHLLEIVESDCSSTSWTGAISYHYDDIDRNLFADCHVVGFLAGKLELSIWRKFRIGKKELPHCLGWRFIDCVRDSIVPHAPFDRDDFGIYDHILGWNGPDVFDVRFDNQFATGLIPNQVTVRNGFLIEPSPLRGMKRVSPYPISLACGTDRCPHIAGLGISGFPRELDLTLSGLPQSVRRGAQVSGGAYQSISYERQESREESYEPIWSVIQKGIVPTAFLVSFGVLFLLPGRAAGYGVLLFGLGWLGLIVWYGLLRLE